MYNENIQLDVLLSKNITVDLSNEFRNKLEASMGKAIIRKQVSLYNLLNIQWVAIALFTLLGAVTYYFADIESMEQSQLLSQFFSHFGNDTIYLFNIVVISILLLIIFEYALKHISKLRSTLIL
jgi:small-conductance mechanosensitive channel